MPKAAAPHAKGCWEQRARWEAKEEAIRLVAGRKALRHLEVAKNMKDENGKVGPVINDRNHVPCVIGHASATVSVKSGLVLARLSI
jgi:hypothetical protein